MKKVTILDIAKELNITFSTVARALKDHPAISATTKEAVKEAAQRLNYRQNKLASSLRSGKTNIIGVIIPSIELNFFSSVVHGIEKVMNENGYTVLLYQSNELFDQEAKGIDSFLQSRVDGIIASIAMETKDLVHFQEIKKKNVPLLLFDRTNKELSVPSVKIDDFKGGFLATEHLIKKGYKRIVHITTQQSINIFTDRLNGYKEALKFYNLPLDEDQIYYGKVSIDSGREAINQFLKTKKEFDAVFAVEDFTALGAIQQLKELEIKVPEEVGVIGFANESFGQYITPSLSSIDQQTTKMGEEVAKLFLKLNKNQKFYENAPEEIILDPILIERESSLRKVDNQEAVIRLTKF